MCRARAEHDCEPQPTALPQPKIQRSRRRAGRGGQGSRKPPTAASEPASASGGTKHNDRPAPLKVSCEEVIAAVESLYVDEVRPYGRILIKRLAELSSKHGGDAPRINTAHLRRVCEDSDLLVVVPEDGHEYSALLAARAQQFVDANSNEDPFPEEFWRQAADFFASGSGLKLSLPSGRYACASTLVSSGIFFLQGYSLGQVCHFVQLAISKRQILGFRDDHVVPYDCSAAVVKKRCASLQQPALELKKDRLPIADLAQARECLKAMLATASQGKIGLLPLSNVKRLFRSKFQLELSETALGHSRICDLLQDKRFSDICSLCLQGSTYMVAQEPASPRETSVEMVNSEHYVDQATDKSSQFSVDADFKRITGASPPTVARTFIHFEPLPPKMTRRSSSVPKNHGSSWPETMPCAHPVLAPSLDTDDGVVFTADCERSSTKDNVQEAEETAGRVQFCPDEPLCLDDLNGGDLSWDLDHPLLTPSPQYISSASTYDVSWDIQLYESSEEFITLFESLGLRHTASSRSSCSGVDVANESVVASLSNVGLDSQTSDASEELQLETPFYSEDPLRLGDTVALPDDVDLGYAVTTPSPLASPRFSSGLSSPSQDWFQPFGELPEPIKLFESLGLAQGDESASQSDTASFQGSDHTEADESALLASVSLDASSPMCSTVFWSLPCSTEALACAIPRTAVGDSAVTSPSMAVALMGPIPSTMPTTFQATMPCTMTHGVAGLMPASMPANSPTTLPVDLSSGVQIQSACFFPCLAGA